MGPAAVLSCFPASVETIEPVALCQAACEFGVPSTNNKRKKKIILSQWHPYLPPIASIPAGILCSARERTAYRWVVWGR